MLELWGYENIKAMSSDAEFWTLDCDGAHKEFGISKDFYWC